jgi:hypothetical protein
MSGKVTTLVCAASSRLTALEYAQALREYALHVERKFGDGALRGDPVN